MRRSALATPSISCGFSPEGISCLTMSRASSNVSTPLRIIGRTWRRAMIPATISSTSVIVLVPHHSATSGIVLVLLIVFIVLIVYIVPLLPLACAHPAQLGERLVERDLGEALARPIAAEQVRRIVNVHAEPARGEQLDRVSLLRTADQRGVSCDAGDRAALERVDHDLLAEPERGG